MPIFGKRVPYVPRHMRGIEEDRDTDIYHHGIEGMKWGVRNGPPYPLKQPRTDISKEFGEYNTDE